MNFREQDRRRRRLLIQMASLLYRDNLELADAMCNHKLRNHVERQGIDGVLADIRREDIPLLQMRRYIRSKGRTPVG